MFTLTYKIMHLMFEERKVVLNFDFLKKIRRFILVSWLRPTDPDQSCIGLSTAQKRIAPEKSAVGQKGERVGKAADPQIQDRRRNQH